MIKFCTHNWVILSERLEESPIMKLIKTGGEYKRKGMGVEPIDLSSKLIQIVSCKKCGKLKKFVEKIG